MRDKFTPQQAQFIIEYLVDLNGTQAAIRAGYSEKGARVRANHLLTNNNISQAIQEQLDARAERTLITADFVLNSFKEIAVRCMQGKEVVDAFGNPTGVWKFDSKGANTALENLAKHFKLFGDNSNLDDKGAPPKEVKVTVVSVINSSDGKNSRNGKNGGNGKKRHIAFTSQSDL